MTTTTVVPANLRGGIPAVDNCAERAHALGAHIIKMYQMSRLRLSTFDMALERLHQISTECTRLIMEHKLKETNKRLWFDLETTRFDCNFNWLKCQTGVQDKVNEGIALVKQVELTQAECGHMLVGLNEFYRSNFVALDTVEPSVEENVEGMFAAYKHRFKILNGKMTEWADNCDKFADDTVAGRIADCEKRSMPYLKNVPEHYKARVPGADA